MSSVVYFCPSCGGEDVRIHEVGDSKPERISMNDLPRQAELKRLPQPMVHLVRRYRAICGHCGHAVEWS